VIIWTAVIEEDFGQERFLTEHPIKLINSGRFEKVPVLAGITKDEFAYKAFCKILQ
jgi:carboxylesterase type B